ncbi:transposase [Streptomyces sp. NPDC060085]|uniref:transposase n=1 Tax=Streptomyces sp. NPDC060085 TaxID=3347054 RepID=UPI0036624864
MLGGRRRGLRSQPAPAHRPGETAGRLRTRRSPRPPDHHPRGHVPRRRHDQEAAAESLAETLRRRRSQGHRFYDWALVDLTDDRPGHNQLLVRRNRRNRRTGERAVYRCDSAAPAPLSTLVRVAGRRWTVEETFQSGKGLTGLDQHQVRCWTSWHRWVTLAMLAHAFLTVVRADEHVLYPKPDGLIPLTCNEIQRLFIALVVRPVHGTAHRLDWSHWRRRHQARSQASHYRRQAAQT